MQMTWFCVVSQRKVEHFLEVCRRGMKVSGNKSKVMVLVGEERLECEVHVDCGTIRASVMVQIFWECFG